MKIAFGNILINTTKESVRVVAINFSAVLVEL
ncbi:hypothetical protein M918_00040 [Clostridium sp. BL8]|nr:hypothetical protein M918_00040 [Clostridium sp. BL8]